MSVLARGATPRTEGVACYLSSTVPQEVVTIRIVVSPDVLTVEVADEGCGAIARARAVEGSGLRIVDEFADAWGATWAAHGCGFRVLVAGA